MEHRILPLVKAIRLLARAFPAPRTFSLSVDRVVGRYAARDYRAPHAVPARRAAACDGFILDVSAPAGEYRVTGEYSCSAPPPHAPGEACTYRVEKGTSLPEGTDVVPAASAVLVSSATVRLPSPKGEAVIPIGGLLASGTAIAARGERIGPGAAALLRVAAFAEVEVLDPPVVHIVAIGTEIIGGHVPNVVTPWLMDALGALGIPVASLGVVPDDEANIRKCIVDALAGGIVVSCGGTGGGLTDRTIASFRPGGVRFVAESIALVPGETAAIALARTGACLFMPGDPEHVVALTHALLRPALVRRLHMKTASWEDAPLVPLSRPWSGPPHAHVFVPAVRTGESLVVTDLAGAGGLLRDQSYALLPPGARERRHGVVVPA